MIIFWRNVLIAYSHYTSFSFRFFLYVGKYSHERLSTILRKDTRIIRVSSLSARLHLSYHRNCRFIVGRLPVSGQRLISQEILLLPLIYRAKLSDTEACLGKSPYNWLQEGLQATPFRLLSFPRSCPPHTRASSSCNSRRLLFQSPAGKFTMRSRRRILLLKLSLPHNFHLPCPLCGELYTSRISFPTWYMLVICFVVRFCWEIM